jgi:hypothetical protein
MSSSIVELQSTSILIKEWSLLCERTEKLSLTLYLVVKHALRRGSIEESREEYMTRFRRIYNI